MREKLAEQYGERDRFTGIFSNFGTKRSYKYTLTTVLLLNITDKHGIVLTDHLWFNFTKEFETIYTENHLQTGAIVSFNARVVTYVKGYEKDIVDYKLSHPRCFVLEGVDPQFQGKTHTPPFEFERRNKVSLLHTQLDNKKQQIDQSITSRQGKTLIVDIHKLHGVRPPFDIYIGRAFDPITENDTIWANPFHLNSNYNERAEKMLIDQYLPYILTKIQSHPHIYDLEKLRGKILGCWCVTTTEVRPLRCHGQILLHLLHLTENTIPLGTIDTIIDSLIPQKKSSKTLLDY